MISLLGFFYKIFFVYTKLYGEDVYFEGLTRFMISPLGLLKSSYTYNISSRAHIIPKQLLSMMHKENL